LIRAAIAVRGAATGRERHAAQPHHQLPARRLDAVGVDTYSKTENFTYTGNRNLDKTLGSIQLPMQLGFPCSQSSHLVGIGEYTTPWDKARRLALGEI